MVSEKILGCQKVLPEHLLPRIEMVTEMKGLANVVSLYQTSRYKIPECINHIENWPTVVSEVILGQMVRHSKMYLMQSFVSRQQDVRCSPV